MDKRTAKLARVYRIGRDDAQMLVDAGLDTPRKIKADKDELDKVNLPKSAKDKVKARK